MILSQGLWGQIQTGRISGTIYDPNKAVVPNATVTVTNKATNVAQKIVSNETGGYVVPALNPGLYDVSVTAPGFRTTVRSGVEMLVGKDLLLDMDLVLGETNTAVTLPASAISYAPYGDSVFVVGDMKDANGRNYRGVRQQFVKLGPSRGDQIAVLSGIKPGEEIVTSGVFKLRNGAAVSIDNKVQPENKRAPKPEES